MEHLGIQHSAQFNVVCKRWFALHQLRRIHFFLWFADDTGFGDGRGDDEAGQEMKAKYPLSEARIDVAELPGKPGAYRAVAFLKPHFQLDELSVSLRLVANLPQPAK